MTPFLLSKLADPITHQPLKLMPNATYEGERVVMGTLISPTGKKYPIVNGIPRFIEQVPQETVTSFGNEWNYFNFSEFKENWLDHTVKNTFGDTKAFKDKIIVDCGGGSGMQSLWFLEAGAKHVIVLDLSHSVDGIMLQNIDRKKWPNVDIIQCSIDAPPLLPQSISGIVYCHNVIQHTPSVEGTAEALYHIVGQGGEFVFNCYHLNTKGWLRWLRFYGVYQPLRAILSKMPFKIILGYARLMGVLSMVPYLGKLLEKMGFLVLGEVPQAPNSSAWQPAKQRYKNVVLNTFDGFGSHEYQHHKSHAELQALTQKLQPDNTKTLNQEKYYQQPMPVGTALRVQR